MTSLLEAPAPAAPVRSLAAAIEERLLVPTYSSRWAFASVAAHRGLALPLQLAGRMHRWRASLNGSTIDIIGIGRKKRIEPLCTQLFGNLPPSVEDARRWLGSPAALADVAADVVVAGVHRWMAPRFRRAGWLIVPHSVRWVGELATVPPREPSHGLRDNLRKIKQQAFRIEQASEAADWDEFYTRMVAPQALARHGPTAWIPSRRLISEFSRVGTLHLVMRGQERVAGMCTVSRGDTIWLALSGVRDGDPVLLRQGAGFAVMALTIEWARTQGYRRIDLGRTGPFINGGLQQLKRRLGLVPVVDSLAHVAAIRIGSPQVGAVFSEAPVLIESAHGLTTYAGEAR